jgi:hypothetical protein
MKLRRIDIAQTVYDWGVRRREPLGVARNSPTPSTVLLAQKSLIARSLIEPLRILSILIS